MNRYVRLSTQHVALGTLLLASRTALAQDDRPSHVPVPRTSDADPTRLFRDRIQSSQSRADLDTLLKRFASGGAFGNAEQLQRLLESNPQLREMAERMQKDLSSGDPETRDRYRSLMETVIKSNPELARQHRLTPEKLEQALRNGSTNPPPGDPVSSAPAIRSRDERPPTRTADGSPDPPRRDPAHEAARREWTNRITDWANKFPKDRLNGALRDSPAVKDMFSRLTDSAADALRATGGAEGLDSQLARWEARFKSAGEWLPTDLPDAFKGLNLPDLSNVPRPNWDMPELDVSPPAFSAPQLSAASMDVGMAANVLLGLVGVAVVAAVIWRLRGGTLTTEDGGRRPLGPWPLDPARVATREELIRAFEYLSLLRCGEPARAWHHHAIADRLGGSEVERRAAAEQLAQLYEQARYAPAASGEPDWAAARGPLVTLAGAG